MGIHQALNNPFQVYGLICGELSKILDRMKVLIPEIELARPGGTSGILELCALNNSVDKAKLLLQRCAESSKLYLAITGEAILAQCQRIKDSMIRSLCNIQDMVPSQLAHKITEVLDYLSKTKFVIDPAEEEAGRALLNLLQQTDSSDELEFESFQVAALSLQLTSATANLVEKRSLKKLLEKFRGTDAKKEKILKYFLYLLEKHGKNIRQDGSEHKPKDNASRKNVALLSNPSIDAMDCKKNGESGELGEAQKTSSTTSVVPPEEFCCPISSKLMDDPVIITSGQTFERKNIEQWFRNGHDTCPKTHLKLENLSIVPNSSLKVLIANWRAKQNPEVSQPRFKSNEANFHSWECSTSSISSLKNVPVALGDYFLQNDYSNTSFVSSDASYYSDSSHVAVVGRSDDSQGSRFSWSDDYLKYQSFSSFNIDMFARFLSCLFELPQNLQVKAVEDVKFVLVNDEDSCYSMLFNGFPDALIRYLNTLQDLSDVQNRRTGYQLLLACISNSRMVLSSLDEKDVLQLVSLMSSNLSFEALQILQILVHCRSFRLEIVSSGVVASVFEIMYSEDPKIQELSLKIVSELSYLKEIQSHILSFGCLSKLDSLMSNGNLGRFCLKIIHNVANSEEGAELVAKTTSCLTAVVELLDIGDVDEQEQAVAILYSICSKSYDNCELVMNEGVIPALVAISVNGNAEGKELAKKLLHLLRDIGRSNHFTSPPREKETEPAPQNVVVESPVVRKPVSRPSGLFRKLFSRALTSF